MPRKKKPEKTTAQKLRQFRKDFAKLKKLGVVKPKDARSVKPTKHYKKVIKDNLALVNGRQQAIKVSAAKATELKKQGYKILKGRVIVDKIPDQIVRANPKSKYGFSVTFKGEHPTTRLDVPPAETTNRRLQKFLKLKINEDSDNRFYATIFGNNTLTVFNSREKLAAYLKGYGNNSSIFAQNITFYSNPAITGAWYYQNQIKRRGGKPAPKLGRRES